VKEITDLDFEVPLFILLKNFFNMQSNLKTWGRRLYLPSEGRCTADF
jgi:hypothetical protein